MPIVSYSQNFEDVILWRALGHIENGFYVDVGAHHPTHLSVTKALYEAGWRGINIEPNSTSYANLQSERARDLNINVAAGNRNGSIDLYETSDPALSTTSISLLPSYEKRGIILKKVNVKVRTLDSILNDSNISGDIHLLNIDVEGAELEVLKGLNLKKWRPWILVIEATKPTTSEPTHSAWESRLIDGDYDFVYFDGLNRFYVSKEHAELKEHFKLPPNVFDEIVPAALLNERAAVERLSVEIKMREKAMDLQRVALEQATQTNKNLSDSFAQVSGSLQKLHESNSQIVQSLTLEQHRLKAAHAEVGRLQAIIGEHKIELGDLRSKLSSDFESKLSELTRDHAKKVAIVRDHAEQLELKLSDSIRSSNEYSLRLEREIAAREALKSAFESELSRAQGEARQRQVEIEQAKEKIGFFTSENAGLNSSLLKLNGEIGLLSQELTDLRVSLDAERCRSKEYSDKLEVLQRKSEELLNQKEIYRQERDLLKQLSQQLEAREAQLRVDCDRLQRDLEAKVTDLKESEERRLDSVKQIEAKERVIQNFRRSLFFVLCHGPLRRIPVLRLALGGLAMVPFLARRAFHDLRVGIRKRCRSLLGVLYQFPARDVKIPASYFSAHKLSSLAPKISIVTPSFNYGGFIERTIKSVLNQGYPNLEYVIQDGGSKDNTSEVVERYRSALKHWESVKDRGQSDAINRGFRHCTGEIMAYLNSDDLLLPNSLQYVAEFFLNNPDIDVVYGHRLVIDENDKVVGEWIVPPHNSKAIKWADYIPQETLFWRRRIWEKVGGRIDDSFQFAMDWDLILRFQEAGAKFYRLPRLIGAFRVHPNQKTSAHISSVGEREVGLLRLRHIGRDVTHKEVVSNIRSYLRRSVLSFWAYRLEIISHRLRSLLNRKYIEDLISHAPRSLYVYSLHKCGTSLFTNYMRQALNREHVDYETMLFDNKLQGEITFEDNGKLYGVLRVTINPESVQGRTLGRHVFNRDFVSDKTTLFLIRDPRDLLVSYYYSMGQSHVSSDNPDITRELEITRKSTASFDLDSFAVSRASELLLRYNLLMDLMDSAYIAHVIRYEDLIEDFARFSVDFSSNIPLSDFYFDQFRRASRPNVKEDLTAHKRSGRSGQYREKFKPETISKLDEIFAPILDRFGYK